MTEAEEPSEKKKSDTRRYEENRKKIFRFLQNQRLSVRLINHPEKSYSRHEEISGRHDPVIEKPSKAFSIKEIISEDIKPAGNRLKKHLFCNEPEVTYEDQRKSSHLKPLKQPGWNLQISLKVKVPEL